jgi:hypothetical protein
MQLPTPSAEAAAMIQQRIDELRPVAPGGWTPGEWPRRVCKEELNALPVDAEAPFLWAAVWVLYAVLARRAQVYPEIQELVPARPAEARRCDACGGTGTAAGGSGSRPACRVCRSLGWLMPGRGPLR